VSVVTGCRLTDNLPCSTKFVLKNNEEQHEHGYRLGAVINDKVPPHFADHLLFIIIAPYGSMVGILSLLCVCLSFCTITDFSAVEKVRDVKLCMHVAFLLDLCKLGELTWVMPELSCCVSEHCTSVFLKCPVTIVSLITSVSIIVHHFLQTLMASLFTNCLKLRF